MPSQAVLHAPVEPGTQKIKASGGAGLAALFQNIEGIGDESRVLCVLSEASDA